MCTTEVITHFILVILHVSPRSLWASTYVGHVERTVFQYFGFVMRRCTSENWVQKKQCIESSVSHLKCVHYNEYGGHILQIARCLFAVDASCLFWIGCAGLSKEFLGEAVPPPPTNIQVWEGKGPRAPRIQRLWGRGKCQHHSMRPRR